MKRSGYRRIQEYEDARAEQSHSVVSTSRYLNVSLPVAVKYVRNSARKLRERRCNGAMAERIVHAYFDAWLKRKDRLRTNQPYKDSPLELTGMTMGVLRKTPLLDRGRILSAEESMMLCIAGFGEPGRSAWRGVKGGLGMIDR